MRTRGCVGTHYVLIYPVINGFIIISESYQNELPQRKLSFSLKIFTVHYSCKLQLDNFDLLENYW